MADQPIPRREIELLALRALAGERVPLLLGRRRYTLTVNPIFRVEEGGDGFLYLCLGLESLTRRLEALSGPRAGGSAGTVAELGGARGSH